MSATTIVHDFRLSFEENTFNNAISFMERGEPFRDDLLSSVKTVLRQSAPTIVMHQEEIDKLKENLERHLRGSRGHRVRDWEAARRELQLNEIQPLEDKIKVVEERSAVLEKCLKFHTKEVKRRQKAEFKKQVKQFPERVKALLESCSEDQNEPLLTAIHSLNNALAGESLQHGVEHLLSLSQSVKHLEDDQLILESHGAKLHEIPPDLYTRKEQMKSLQTSCELILGQEIRFVRPFNVKRRLQLSKAIEQQKEDAAKVREGLA